MEAGRRAAETRIILRLRAKWTIQGPRVVGLVDGRRGRRVFLDVDFFVAYEDPENPRHKIVLEDDGCVAYAYYLEDEAINGLVWLYNSANSDLRTEEQTRDEGAPPTMPKDNIKEPSFAPVTDESQFGVDWVSHGDRRDAVIYIREYIHAVVSNGEYPGACRIALADSSLAQAWDVGD